MTVTAENGSLKVLLTPFETVELGLHELFSRPESPKARGILFEILKIASARAAFCPETDRISIEIRNSFSGNCEILFTPEKTKPSVIVRPRLHYVSSVAEFSDSGSLLDAIETLFFNGFRAYDSRLYSKNGAYRLILSHPGREKPFKDFNCSVTVSPYTLASTAEHWMPVCESLAIETVGKALVKP